MIHSIKMGIFALLSILMIGACTKESASFDVNVHVQAPFVSGSAYVMKLGNQTASLISGKESIPLSSTGTFDFYISDAKPLDAYKVYILRDSVTSVQQCTVTWSYQGKDVVHIDEFAINQWRFEDFISLR